MISERPNPNQPADPPEERPQPMIGPITSLTEMQRMGQLHERLMRNAKWIFAHWATLIAQAGGKYVGVACEEPFISDTYGRAHRLAAVAHPEEGEAIRVQRIPTEERIWILALRRSLDEAAE
jgi:hypothetical protein